MMNDLKKLKEKEFAEPLLAVLTQWMEKSKQKLDPKEFRTLYINKIYSSIDFQTS
jgi:hypothetical protein